jgi:hypothetical protein
MIADAIGEMVESDQVLTDGLQASLWVVKAIFQLERNGALFRVESEVRPKNVDNADIVREAIYQQLAVKSEPLGGTAPDRRPHPRVLGPRNGTTSSLRLSSSSPLLVFSQTPRFSQVTLRHGRRS